MLSKEEIEISKADLKQLYGLLGKKPSLSQRAIKNILQYVEELETDKQKLIEKLEEKEKLNDKYLQKLVYALSPTTHALGDSYNNAFKSIIADKIDLETCKIKRELKDCWEGRF